MRVLIGLVLATFAALLQATFNPQIRIFGGEPDLVFLLVLVWAARAPLAEALALAFVGGLSLDLLSAGPLGLHTGAVLPIVFAIDFVREQLFGFGFPLVVVFAAGGTLVYKLILFVGVSIAGFTLPPVQTFAFTLMPTLIYNVALLLPTFLVLRRLARPAVKR
jgi:rod shape-determining protein MreD